MVVLMVLWYIFFGQLKPYQIPQEKDGILFFFSQSYLGNESVALYANQYG